MEKLIVTETFAHADGLYRITCFSEDDPVLNRVSGSTPAMATTVELQRHGSWQLVFRWISVPIPGQRTLKDFTLVTPQIARVAITLSQEELDRHVNAVYGTYSPQLDAALRKEPMPRWKVVLAILLFDAAFTFGFWMARLPLRLIIALQIPLLGFSFLYFLLARRVLDRKKLLL